MRAYLWGCRLGAVVLLTEVASGCAEQVIIDDFGTAGYARLQGTVTRANGAVFAGGTLYISCGHPEPDWFGMQASTTSAGTFDVSVDAPHAGSLPATRELVCEVRAVSGPTVVARQRAPVRFSQDPAQRPIVQFALVEGTSGP